MVLILIFIIATLLSYYTPTLFDDWNFMRIYLDCNGGSNTFSLEALCGHIGRIRSFDNCRLSNVMTPLFGVIPFLHVLFPLVTGCVVSSLAYLLVRFGLGRRPNAKELALSASLCILVLPWRDGLFVADYSLNYPYSAVISLVFIGVLMKGLHCGFSWQRTAAALLLAALLGWWHEGFALTTIAGGGIVTVFRRFRMPWQWYAAGAVCLAVTLIAFLCPGMIDRMGRSVGHAGRLGWLHVAVNFIPVFFVLVLSAYVFLSRRYKSAIIRFVHDDIYIMFVSIALFGMVMSMSVEHSVRTSFWPSCAAMVGLWRIYAGGIRPSRLVGNVVCGVSVCAALVVSVSAIVWQRRYWEESRIVEELIEQSSTGVVYYDIIGREACPVHTLYIPVRHGWQSPLNMLALSHYRGKRVGIVPTALRSFNKNELVRVAGTAGMMRYRDYLIYLPEGRKDNPPHDLCYTFIDGSVICCPEQFNFRFVNDDGVEIVYHKAWKVVPCRIKRIDGM